MLVIDDGRLSTEGYVRPILATLRPTCRIPINEIHEESMDVLTRASTKAENVP